VFCLVYGFSNAGSVAWADHTNNGDIWTRPQPIGPDYDFGAGANLFTVPGTGEQLLGIGQKCGVYWAVNPSTGKVVWQTPDPNDSPDTAPLSVANGVVYGGSISTTGTSMYGLDAATGAILWSFNSAGSVTGGAAISAGSVYWGSGYCGSECLATRNPLNNNKVYAFGLR